MNAILLITLYFTPYLVAGFRGHYSRGSIFFMNLLLGWTLIFWLWAFIWAWNGNIPRGNK